MSDEKALLAAIWEHPHEDTPRLVYADWLQENGQPERAEFIRVQIELAGLDQWDESPRKTELTQREKQLWDTHAETWKKGLPSAIAKRTGFHRGFAAPVHQRISPGKFLKLTTADLAAAPLWNFRIDTNRHSFPNLLASPSLLRVDALEFSGWLETPEETRQFATSPNIRNLASLTINHTQFDDPRMTELSADAVGLPNLRRLNLGSNRLTADAIRTFAKSPLADGIDGLDLSANPLGPEGVLTLANSPQLARLQLLSAWGCGRMSGGIELNGEVVKSLCDSQHLGGLRVLNLSYNGLSKPDILKMCEARPKFRLAVLSLSNSDIGDAGAEALAAWPVLEHIRTLVVTSCGIATRGARALVRSPYLNHVTQLWIQGNPVMNDPSLMASLRSRFGKALREK
ncbi:MAG: TIGR02996 domain-containing protein [Planctomycetes bacterium]|nr:TIGR02996 domain-containing protein [Planctomycetota bacterium]